MHLLNTFTYRKNDNETAMQQFDDNEGPDPVARDFNRGPVLPAVVNIAQCDNDITPLLGGSRIQAEDDWRNFINIPITYAT